MGGGGKEGKREAGENKRDMRQREEGEKGVRDGG